MLLELGILVMCAGFYTKAIDSVPMWLSILIIVLGVILVAIWKFYITARIGNMMKHIQDLYDDLDKTVDALDKTNKAMEQTKALATNIKDLLKEKFINKGE